MFKRIGPGLLVAAAGIGAGDMLIGIQIGLDFQWLFAAVVLFTCLLKYVITEGIARHQLITGKTVIQRWNLSTPKGLRIVFLLFLLLWSLMVGAALLSASGLAANSFLPFLDTVQWAFIHAAIAFLFVYFGKYQAIEKLTIALIGLMFFILIPTAIYLFIFTEVSSSKASYDTATLVMSIIGGVGGSVTMLSYGYWLNEKKWTSKDQLGRARFDLRFSYIITGLFVFALMIIASRLNVNNDGISGSELVFLLSKTIGSVIGSFGEILFKICFWGVVFSSLITVWSGVPYLYVDFYEGLTKHTNTKSKTESKSYKGFLVFLSLAPLGMTYAFSTLKNIINYTLISSVFVIGICITLLLINSKKKWMNEFQNSLSSKFILGLSILTFIILLIGKLLS